MELDSSCWQALNLAKAQARLCLAPSYPLRAATEGGRLYSSLRGSGRETMTAIGTVVAQSPGKAVPVTLPYLPA